MFDTDDTKLVDNTPETSEHKPDHRPHSFDAYAGQGQIKEKLQVYTQAAQQRGEPVDHILLFGPPGLGKTTLAHIVANTLNAHITVCSGPTLERTGDLVAILSSLHAQDILFIDEIHRLPSAVEEMLYSAMEQFKVDVIIGQGAGAKSVTLPLQPFTLIGATTKSGMIAAPLRTRFGIIERLAFYSVEELTQIIQYHAGQLNINIDHNAAATLAQASRGTPRIARKLLRRARDFAQVHTDGHVTEDITRQTLNFLGIDAMGLSHVDRSILYHIYTTYGGGPVGLDTIAAIVSEDSNTIEDMYEPFLIRQGLLEKTPRGRRIPPAMRHHVTKLIDGQEHI